MNLRFDHTYCADQAHKFRKKLARAGFHLIDREVEHPGKKFCRFIMFAPEKNKRQYLEFIHTGRGGKLYRVPGFSLGSDSPLKPIFLRIEKALGAKFEHKNYEWKQNSTDYLPGWNFVTFPAKTVRHIRTWITEYEASSTRKIIKKKDATHPNGANAIVAFDMKLSSSDIKFYSKLFGKPRDGQFRLKSGVKINFVKTSVSRIDSVVVSTPRFDRLVRKFEYDRLIVREGKPAVLIEKLNPKMWDVVVIETFR